MIKAKLLSLALILALASTLALVSMVSTQANEPPAAYDLSNPTDTTISDGQGIETIAANDLVRW
jgi:hypothetical protein